VFASRHGDGHDAPGLMGLPHAWMRTGLCHCYCHSASRTDKYYNEVDLFCILSLLEAVLCEFL
jgi:hypothetical protein